MGSSLCNVAKLLRCDFWDTDASTFERYDARCNFFGRRSVIKRLLITGAALMALIGTSAFAADMPLKAPPMVPGAVPAYNWTGWYVGLNAGGAWGNDPVDNTVASNTCSGPIACAAGISTLNALIPGQFDTKPSGFIGGGQIGYNFQFAPAWVAGIEADFQGANIKDGATQASAPTTVPGFTNVVTISASGSQKIDWLGTLRGRLGWLAVPRLLIYGTGGLAYGHVQTDGSFSGNVTTPNPANAFNGSNTVSQSDIRAGWALGGGLEWMIAPHWTIKAEYLYFDLGHVTLNQTFALVSPIPAAVSANISSEAHFDGSIARAGLNYKF